jgi:HD-GYP domain-containing protein (c-di-GMP phosphodiesterase class II)
MQKALENRGIYFPRGTAAEDGEIIVWKDLKRGGASMRNIQLNRLVSALSLALDLAEYKGMGHGRRIAYTALRLGKALGIEGDRLKDIYFAALFHDIGITDPEALNAKDEEKYKKHPAVGEGIVRKFHIGKDAGSFILHHHENYDGTGCKGVKGEDIPLEANIIRFADQFDAIYYYGKAKFSDDRDKVEKWARENRGKVFAPVIVDAFLDFARSEKFWLDYSSTHLNEILQAMEPGGEETISGNDLEEICRSFALIIDSKSKYTYRHSTGVACLAKMAGKQCGWDGEKVKKMEIAGYLHDLGRLAIPNSIIDKKNKLTLKEFNEVKVHSYYTKTILSFIPKFEEIKEWAANHHETLDGEGYPEMLTGKDLGLEDRIMAACDIYQALTEERPYRPALNIEDALGILHDYAEKGKLCPRAVELVKEAVYSWSC